MNEPITATEIHERWQEVGPSMDVGQAAYDYADELLAAREAGK